jgi:hypothetical protein
MDDRQSAHFLFAEAMGYTCSAALRAVAALGVADHLDRPRTAAELAEATGSRTDALHRTLRLLATRGVFHEDGAGRFHLTAKGSALRADSPFPARAGILMFTDTMFWTLTHQLPVSARQPDPSFERLFGEPLAEYFARNADTEALFYDGMEQVSDAENPLVAERIRFPASGTVADIGGRYGGLLSVVLQRNPGLHGVLFDNEERALDAHRLDADTLAGRWKTVHGDFFQEVPGADIYLLKRIIHNWDDEQCVRILRNCRRAMTPGGRVVVIDAIIPPGNDPHQSKAMDLMMLSALTGRERTEAELATLFEASGLRLVQVVPTDSVMSVAEGVMTDGIEGNG